MSAAVGISASAIVASCLDALLFTPVGVDKAAELVQVTTVDDRQRELGVPRHTAVQLSHSSAFVGTCSFVTPRTIVSIGRDTRAVSGLTLSQECVSTLRLEAAEGRMFQMDDFRPGAASVAVLTHEGRRRLFGSQPDIVGREVRVGGVPTTIVGVAAREFRGFLVGFPALLLRAMPAPTEDSSFTAVNVIGRLPPGRSIESVSSQLRAEWPALSASEDAVAEPLPRHESVVVRPADKGIDFVLRPRFASPLLTMLVLSGGVLAMACFNLVHLLAARRLARHHELAVRTALGARPARLIAGELAGDSILVAAGAALALLMSYGGTRFVLSWLQNRYRGLEFEAAPSLRVVLFVAALALALAGVAATTSCWYILRWRSTGVLSGRSHASSVRAVTRARAALAILQVSGSQSLVLIALTLAAALSRATSGEVGFAPHRVTSAQLMLTSETPDTRAPLDEAYRVMLDDLAARPDVSAAALANSMPFSAPPRLIDVSRSESNAAATAQLELVTSGFFSVLGVPLIHGRPFRPDAHGEIAEAVISVSLSRSLFGSSVPLGAVVQIAVEGVPTPATIVGVAKDIVTGDPRVGNRSAIYVNALRFANLVQSPALLVASSAPPGTVSRVLRDYLNAHGRWVPTRIGTLATELDALLVQERLLSATATGFAAVSYILATLGLYGLLARIVRGRQHEIGVRLAMGAGPRDIVRLVVLHAVRIVGVATLLCVPLTWALHGLLQARIPNVPPLDSSALVLLGVTAVAALFTSALPYLRAVHVDPSALLRGDVAVVDGWTR